MEQKIDLTKYNAEFLNGDVRFITIKPPSEKYWKLDWFRRHVLKVSKTFLAVREKNKKTDGYHFHALAKINALPKKSWYKKGFHIHERKVGRLPIKSTTFTNEEAVKLPMDDPTEEQIQKLHESEKISILLLRKQVQMTKRLVHVKNCLRYMQKELEMPCQYTDYVRYLRGKSHTLD